MKDFKRKSKVKLKMIKIGVREHKLRISIDQQSFDLAYHGSKKEVQWYKKQLTIALKRVLP